MMTISDIARRLGVTRQRAQQIVNEDGFPKPAKEEVVVTRYWRANQVEAWIKRTRVPPIEDRIAALEAKAEALRKKLRKEEG